MRHGARRTRRVLLLAPVAAATVLVLTACDPRQTGAAAVVGTDRVTESQVDRDAQQVVAALDKIGGQVPATDTLLKAQVEFRVDAQLVELAAQRKGIRITQGQIDNLIESNGGRDVLQRQFVAQQDLWLPPEQLDALAREFLTQQALGINLAPGKTADEQGAAATAYVTALAQEIGVTVSPRYGVFEVKTLRVGDLPNDLSVPAGPVGASTSASPTPSPTAS